MYSTHLTNCTALSNKECNCASDIEKYYEYAIKQRETMLSKRPNMIFLIKEIEEIKNKINHLNKLT